MSRANPRFRRVNPQLPAAPNSTDIEVVIQGQIENQMTISTFVYNTPSVLVTTGNLNGFVTAFQAAMYSKYAAVLSGDWTGVQMKVIPLAPATLAPVLDTAINGLAGGQPAGHLPSPLAVTISRYTGTQGQHGRGRISVPAIPLGVVVNSTITPGAYLTALNALGTQMLATINDGTNTWTPGIVTRSKTPPHNVIGFGPLLQCITRTVLGTCRRRKLGRGK